MRKSVYWISQRSQIKAVTNPIRHDIVDRLMASGPLSVRDIARALARKQTAIYRHLRTLEKVGLICSTDTEGQRGRPGAVYRAIAPLIRAARAPRIVGNRGAMAKMAKSMAAQAARDYAQGFEAPGWTLEGPSRNHWFFRVASAPSAQKLARINNLMDELAELLWTQDSEPGPLIHVAWFVSPVTSRKA